MNGLDVIIAVPIAAVLIWNVIDRRKIKMPDLTQDELIYVVAGNYTQAERFARTDLDRTGPGHGAAYGPRPWLYITGPNAVRDRAVDPARVYYTGAWRNRPDMEAILDAVRLCAYQEDPT